MINLLNDIHGISGTNIIVPFTVDPSSITETMNFQIMGKKSSGYVDLGKGLVYVVKTGGTETVTNTISKDIAKNTFIVRISTATHDISAFYIRIYNDYSSILSQKITISKNLEIDFTTKPKVLEFRPKFVNVIDNFLCTYNGTKVKLERDKFEIGVYISNNSTSSNPVWEDVTNEYLDGEVLPITNTKKDDGLPWTISIRYKIKKIISNSTVQVSDIVMTVL